MISSKAFFTLLTKNGVGLFTGVPDSLLKDFCAYVSDSARHGSHIIAANEGNAIALAAGYHLATGGIGLVYMQNSGLGNSVNPLASLADPDVYGIPMIVLIGWRGEPGVKDEPQHVKQGNITLELLETLCIAHSVLPRTESGAKKAVGRAFSNMRKRSAPYALVVKKGTFARYAPKKTTLAPPGARLVRERAIEIIAGELGSEDIVVSTTGKTSRELFELREQSGEGHEKDFLTVGSMGHASQIALGIALSKPKRAVYCLDGDGAVIMHMGGLATIGRAAPKNFKHIVLNNGAHESVGGQPTAGLTMDVRGVARACGYKKALHAQDEKGLTRALAALKSSAGPLLLEVLMRQGSRQDLGRPTDSPKKNKKLFMDFAEQGSSGFTASQKLARFLEEHNAKQIFLVRGKRSYIQSGANKVFGRILSKYSVTEFSDFGISPALEDIRRGIKMFKNKKHNVVVAVGGGSAIDTAKLINALSAQRGSALRFVRGEKVMQKSGKPLAAIPTTAGSGSEATHFAVVYHNKRKYSVAHPGMLPTAAILEPKLARSVPLRLAAVSGMDALAQAIESYWSVNSTPASKIFSSRAINLIRENFVNSIQNPTQKTRSAMMQASHIAGKAINITKTTAPHAISYFFTSHYGIPHGHAVALTLGPLFVYNSEVTSKDVTDARGKSYVRHTMVELEHLLGVASPDAARRKIERIMRQSGLETRLSKFGVSRSDVVEAARAVNVERLKNNPRLLNEKKLIQILLSAL